MINKKRLLKTFIELVSIDSPSGEEEAVSKFLTKKLAKLNAKVKKDKYGNLVAKFRGSGKPLMLNTHMDTVEPGRGIKVKIIGGKIVSNGSTIVGGDAKAGLSEIIEAIETALEKNIKTRPLDLVITCDEETSLGGAKNLDYSLLSAKEGLVFDGDARVNRIIIASPTYYDLKVNITGKAAHAGIEPEKGISAIEIASKLISALPLGRIDEETTFNIGTINGGSVVNAVPEKTTFHGEVRSRNKKTLAKILKETQELFNSIAKQYPNAKINFEFDKQFEGFTFNKTHPLIIEATKALAQIGLEPQLETTGGGSDANVFGVNKLEVVIVGTGVYEPHTTREYVKIDQMIEASDFCFEFIKAQL